MACWCCVSMCSYVHVLCVSLRLSVVGKGVSIKTRWQCQCSFCSSCSILDIWHHETYLFICCKIIFYMTGWVWEHGWDEGESMSVFKLLTNPQQALKDKAVISFFPFSLFTSSPKLLGSYTDKREVLKLKLTAFPPHTTFPVLTITELAFFATLLCRSDRHSSATNSRHINIETDGSTHLMHMKTQACKSTHTHTHFSGMSVCMRQIPAERAI